MSMMDQVRAEMVSAMKSGDKKRKDVLSLLLSDLKAKWIDKRADLTEAEENDVVRREIKQTKETLETAPKDRTDIIEQSRFALSVLEEFAPKEMSEAEIRAAVSGVLEELGISAPTPKDRGRIMKELMPRVQGRADGGTVSRIVGELCSGK
jgi:uncharacterized protein YqeY